MVKITADSTCNLSPEILNTTGITLMLFYILVEDKAFRDGVDITPADIFRHVEKEGKHYETALRGHIPTEQDIHVRLSP